MRQMMRLRSDSISSVQGGVPKNIYYLQTIHLNVWTWRLRGLRPDVQNLPQRMIQPPPPPPAFLCHSFAPSNEVVNGSFDVESFSTKSRIDSHAASLVLASLHSCIVIFFVGKEERLRLSSNRVKEVRAYLFKGAYPQLFGESLCFRFEFG